MVALEILPSLAISQIFLAILSLLALGTPLIERFVSLPPVSCTHKKHLFSLLPCVYMKFSLSYPAKSSYHHLLHVLGALCEQKEAVSTSHCSQSNTIEYEMAIDWCLLQERWDRVWQLLYKVAKRTYYIWQLPFLAVILSLFLVSIIYTAYCWGEHILWLSNKGRSWENSKAVSNLNDAALSNLTYWKYFVETSLVQQICSRFFIPTILIDLMSCVIWFYWYSHVPSSRACFYFSFKFIFNGRRFQSIWCYWEFG